MAWYNKLSNAASWYGNNVISPTLSMMPFGIGQGYTAMQNLDAQQDMFGQNLESQEKWNQINLDYMKEQQQYDRQLQQTMFDREDNSIQRAASDFQAAGLSKTLGVSGAGAGSVVAQHAPSGNAPQGQAAQRGEGQIDLASMMNLMLQDATIGNLVQQNSNLKTQEDINESQNKILKHDLKIYKRDKIPSGASSTFYSPGVVGRNSRDLRRIWDDATNADIDIEEIKDDYQNYLQETGKKDTWWNRFKYSPRKRLKKK